MKKFTFFSVIIIAMFLVMTVCFPAWGAKTIKIGVIGPMQFVQGKGHWNGAVMAAQRRRSGRQQENEDRTGESRLQ
jgi:branched-chain amino acid transport system substrate-binding protein